MKFFASVRIDVRRRDKIKGNNKDGDIVGNVTEVKIVKNKVAPPFKRTKFDVLYGEGISKEGELIDLGVEREGIEKSGSWYSYNKERLGQGRENTKQFLKENLEIRELLEIGIKNTDIVKSEESDSDLAG